MSAISFSTSIAATASAMPATARLSSASPAATLQAMATGLVARSRLIDAHTGTRILAAMRQPDALAGPAPRALATLIAETAAAGLPGATPAGTGALEGAALRYARAVALTIAGHPSWTPGAIADAVLAATAHGEAAVNALDAVLANTPLEPLRAMFNAAARYLDTVNGPEENEPC